MITILLPYIDYGLLLLRVVLGAVFLVHGFPKIKGFKGFAQWLESIHFKPGAFWAGAVVLTEVIGGAAVLLGFLTQIAAILIAVDMVVAILAVQRKKKFVGGWEFDISLFAIAAALVVLGPGDISLDAMLNFVLY